MLALLSRLLLATLLTGMTWFFPARAPSLLKGSGHSGAVPSCSLAYVRGRTRPPIPFAPIRDLVEIALDRGRPRPLNGDALSLPSIASVPRTERTRPLRMPHLRRSLLSLRC